MWSFGSGSEQTQSKGFAGLMAFDQETRLADDRAMVDLSAISPVFGVSSQIQDVRHPRLVELYETGKRQQWNATTDLKWTTCSQLDSVLPDDSYFALASFDGSPLAKYGRPMWNMFRSEFQCWMISQFLPGEKAAMIAAARVLEVIPDPDARYCLASQVIDEARHIEVFSRYLRENVPAPYTVSPSLARLLRDTLNDSRWDVTVLGMHIMVEALAMAALRLADRTFHDNLIRQICRLVARDEVRHVSVGILSLQSIYADMTEAELRERREFVLEALNLVSRRFLLEEIWERMGVDHDQGIAFAKTNELMIKYRQAICTKVVSGLVSIGLMNDGLRNRLDHLKLLGSSWNRMARVGSLIGRLGI
jgi:hypothetical protein